MEDKQFRNNFDDEILNIQRKFTKPPSLSLDINLLPTRPTEQNNLEFGSTSSRRTMNNSISPWTGRPSKKLPSKDINTGLKDIPNLKLNDHINSLRNSQPPSTKNKYGGYTLFEYPKNQSIHIQNSKKEFSINKIKKEKKIKQANLISSRMNPDFSKVVHNNANNFGFAFYPTHNPKKNKMSILTASLVPNSQKILSPKTQINNKFIQNSDVGQIQKNQINTDNEILGKKKSEIKLRKRGLSQQSFKTHENIAEDYGPLFYEKRITTASPTNLRNFHSFANSSLSHNRTNFMGISLINQGPKKALSKKSSGKFVSVFDNNDLNSGCYIPKNYRNLSLLHKTYYANVLKKNIHANAPEMQPDLIRHKQRHSDILPFSKSEKLENDGSNKNNNVNLETTASKNLHRKMFRNSSIKSSSFRDDFTIDLLDSIIRKSRSKAENIKQNLSRNKNVNNSNNDFGPW